MSKKLVIIPALLMFMAIGWQAKGQGATDVLRYSVQYPSYDPVSIVMPGVSSATGFGAYQENPASMALFEEGFFSFGLSNRYVNEESSYLGTGSEFDDNQANIGDIGLVYKVPTQRGRLVVGGGYSQTSDFNRALSVNARNNQSTITDFYNITADDSLFFAAFDAYAIDFFTTDSTFSETASIFRIGFNEFGQYPGINQSMELTERGVMGEYSAFVATEFQQNVMVGVSLGLISGGYDYEREFLESDDQNNYNFQFIDTDGDGVGETDIDNILSYDTISADFTAFTARLGLLYEINPNINIGASYQFNGKLSIDEDYNTLITSTFDNGVVFEDDAPGRFSYKIKRPDRFNLGITFKELNGINISLSAENVRYSQARIEFEDIRLGGDEDAINDTIESNFQDVFNIRGGLEFVMSPYFTPRVGYAYFPSPQEDVGSERQFISGGFSASLFDKVTLDVGAQYSFWEDQNQLYSYFDGNSVVGETTGEDVTRWNIMAGVKIAL